MISPLPLLSCKSSVSVKENPDREKKSKLTNKEVIFKILTDLIMKKYAVLKKYPVEH